MRTGLMISAYVLGFAILYLLACWVLVPVSKSLLWELGVRDAIRGYFGELKLQEYTGIIVALVFGYAAARLMHQGWLMSLGVGVVSLVICWFLQLSCPITLTHPEVPEQLQSSTQQWLQRMAQRGHDVSGVSSFDAAFAAHRLKVLLGVPLAFAVSGLVAGRQVKDS